MLTLIKVVLTALGTFIYITLFELKKLEKLSEKARVFEARKILKTLARRIIKAAKINLEVEYEDKVAIEKLRFEDGIVFIANHQSNFDIPILVSALDIPIGFVAKKEMESWPFYSTWMKESNCIFLDRSNPREGIKSMKKATAVVKSGYPTVIFPEGERSLDGQIKTFKKGSFKLAKDANGVIIPILIDGAFDVQKKKSIRINSNQTVFVKVGKPIHVQKYDENKKGELNKYVQEQIQKMKSSKINTKKV
nr:lysophospholipid acyltransferase family protein [uncultured Cetobacterium sp.]